MKISSSGLPALLGVASLVLGLGGCLDPDVMGDFRAQPGLAELRARGQERNRTLVMTGRKAHIRIQFCLRRHFGGHNVAGLATETTFDLVVQERGTPLLEVFVDGSEAERAHITVHGPEDWLGRHGNAVFRWARGDASCELE